MQRIYKFRVWDNKNKKMKEPFSIEELCAGVWAESRWFKHFNTNQHELMQFTGLRDRNGKDIYEGDVVTRKWMDFVEKGEVKFGKCMVNGGEYDVWGFYINNEDREILVDEGAGNSYEVIGDIYSNPELLSSDNK